MKQIGLLLILPFVLASSCATGPEPQELGLPVVYVPEIVVEAAVPEIPPEEPPQIPLEDPIEVVVAAEQQPFDPAAVSEELYASTKADVQTFIEELNRIIRARNYEAWRAHLSDSFYATISCPVFLEERTAELFRRDQIVASNLGRDPRFVTRRVLRTPRDFFEHVVVPARANDRVDDIAFISETHITAFTVDRRGTRLILYNLAIIDDQWKITN